MEINKDAEEQIVKRIKALRESLDMSFQDLASLTGMSKSTLQRYETGAIKNLPFSKVGILAKALGTTPAYLLGWDETSSSEESNELDAENDRIFKNLPPDKKEQALAFLRFLQGK